MSLRIAYSRRSLRDLKRIRAYIVQESAEPEVADRFLRRLLRVCEALETLPERFPVYPFAPKWRMLPFGNYLIFFRSRARVVEIGHIRHAAKKPFRG